MPATGAARLSGDDWASPHAFEMGGVSHAEIVVTDCSVSAARVCSPKSRSLRRPAADSLGARWSSRHVVSRVAAFASEMQWRSRRLSRGRFAPGIFTKGWTLHRLNFSRRFPYA